MKDSPSPQLARISDLKHPFFRQRSTGSDVDKAIISARGRLTKNPSIVQYLKKFKGFQRSFQGKLIILNEECFRPGLRRTRALLRRPQVCLKNKIFCILGSPSAMNLPPPPDPPRSISSDISLLKVPPPATVQMQLPPPPLPPSGSLIGGNIVAPSSPPTVLPHSELVIRLYT